MPTRPGRRLTPEERREVANVTKEVKKRLAKMKAEREQPLRDLKKRHQLERSTAIQIARQQGLSRRAAAFEVKKQQHLEQVSLKHQLARIENTRIQTWRQEQEALEQAAQLAWQPAPPILALCTQDQRSLAHWTEEVDTRSDDAFLTWLEESLWPDAERSPDIPSFEELWHLTVVNERLHELRQSPSNDVRRRLQKVLAPLANGRPKAPPPSADVVAQRGRLRGALRRLAKNAADSEAKSSLNDEMRQLYPSASPDERDQVLMEAIRKHGRRFSAVANTLIAVARRLSVSHVKKGKAPAPKIARRPRTKTVVAMKHLRD